MPSALKSAGTAARSRWIPDQYLGRTGCRWTGFDEAHNIAARGRDRQPDRERPTGRPGRIARITRLRCFVDKAVPVIIIEDERSGANTTGLRRGRASGNAHHNGKSIKYNGMDCSWKGPRNPHDLLHKAVVKRTERTVSFFGGKASGKGLEKVHRATNHIVSAMHGSTYGMEARTKCLVWLYLPKFSVQKRKNKE